MIDIDPRRVDLAREFRARPFGVHSGDLQLVLNRMRSQPPLGKYFMYQRVPMTIAIREASAAPATPSG